MRRRRRRGRRMTRGRIDLQISRAAFRKEASFFPGRARPLDAERRRKRKREREEREGRSAQRDERENDGATTAAPLPRQIRAASVSKHVG